MNESRFESKSVLVLFTGGNTIGIYKDSVEAEPFTNQFKSDTFRVKLIEATK